MSGSLSHLRLHLSRARAQDTGLRQIPHFGDRRRTSHYPGRCRLSRVGQQDTGPRQVYHFNGPRITSNCLRNPPGSRAHRRNNESGQTYYSGDPRETPGGPDRSGHLIRRHLALRSRLAPYF